MNVDTQPKLTEAVMKLRQENCRAQLAALPDNELGQVGRSSVLRRGRGFYVMGESSCFLTLEAATTVVLRALNKSG